MEIKKNIENLKDKKKNLYIIVASFVEEITDVDFYCKYTSKEINLLLFCLVSAIELLISEDEGVEEIKRRIKEIWRKLENE